MAMVLALTTPGIAAANEIRVALQKQGDAPCTAARVTAISASGERHDWEAPIPDGVTIDIPLNTSWTVSASAHGCWSKPVSLSAGIAVSDLTLPVWRVSRLETKIGFDGAAVPVTVAIRLADETEYVRVECRDALVCDVPAAPIDVRISAAGFGARYVWNLDASTASKLDPIVLRPGSTIAGRVVIQARDRRPAGDITVALRAVDVDPPRTIRTAKTPSSGWFQFDAMPAGTYALSASKDGYATAQTNVVLTDPRNLELETLTLAPLVDFEVTIAPPADPSGAPWQVVLDRRAKETRYLRRIADSKADVAGRWSTKAIDPGMYVITVVDAAGNTLGAREVEVSDAQRNAFVMLSLVPVTGRLTKGGEGVPAQLDFQGRDRTSAVFRAAEDGTFSGNLPREGRWWVDIRRDGAQSVQRRGPIEVRRNESGTATIDLTLGESALRGTVVDETGTPVPGVVFLQRPGKRMIETEAAAGTGAFAFDDLEAGKAMLEARSKKGESGLVEVEIGKSDDELKLIVRERATVSGSIVTSMGYPLTGAYVRAIGPTFRERREAFTGPGGEFTLKVPRGTSAVTIIVLPHDGPIFTRRVAVSNSPARLVAPQHGGRLVLRGGGDRSPFIIAAGGDPVSLADLTYPPGAGVPREFAPDGFAVQLEAGAYSVCSPPLAAGRCKQAQIDAGRSTIVELKVQP